VESKSFLESWKDYTIRDKILFGSFILPFFVSILHLLIYFPVIGVVFYDSFWELFEPGKLFSKFDCVDVVPWWSVETYCATTFSYIISPIWLLLSTISIGIYGFFLFKTSEETSNLLNRVEDTSDPSVLARTNIYMTINAGAQIFIFLRLFIGGWWMGIGEYWHVSEWSDPFRGLTYGYDRYGSEDTSINPLSYLYVPYLIAAVFLAYHTRIKNEEENAEFIEVKSELVTTDAESTSGDPVKQSHVFLLVTLVGGMFGLDKAYKGNYLLAVLKLLTLGGLWIWQIYDIYVAAGDAGRSWSLDSGSSTTSEKHVILITAIAGGFIGLDRAYKGDGVTGVFKLLTLGGLGIWWLVDVYVAAKEAGKSW
jgi:TM2 domain-containing membrane protein YozV